jgi:hypothetical protein
MSGISAALCFAGLQTGSFFSSLIAALASSFENCSLLEK